MGSMKKGVGLACWREESALGGAISGRSSPPNTWLLLVSSPLARVRLRPPRLRSSGWSGLAAVGCGRGSGLECVGSVFAGRSSLRLAVLRSKGDSGAGAGLAGTNGGSRSGNGGQTEVAAENAGKRELGLG